MPKYYGIIKFFSQKSYLDDFLNGRMYCNTPSFYRNSSIPGVSDLREGCRVSSFYNPDNKITINSHTLDSKELKFVIKNYDEPDSYLHCWYSFVIPDETYNGNVHFVEDLIEGLNRIKEEFNNENFVFILFKDIPEFIRRLQVASGKSVEPRYVEYVKDINLIDKFHKHFSYEYQREFRIAIGECSDFSEEPLRFNVEGGFADIALPNAELKLVNADTLEEITLL